MDGGDGDDGEVELLDAVMGSDLEVGPQPGSAVGWFRVDGEGGTGTEGGDELTLDDLVTGGGEGRVRIAELGMTKVVLVALGTDRSLAWAEGFKVQGGGDLSVGEGEGLGRGKNVKGGAAEEGSRLDEGLCVERGDVSEEVGMKGLVRLVASNTLGGGDEVVIDGEGEERSEEVIGRLDSSSVGKGSGYLEGGDAETTKTSRKMSDRVLLCTPVTVGGAKSLDLFPLETVEGLPKEDKVGGGEGALEMTEIHLDAASEEDESGLERKGR